MGEAKGGEERKHGGRDVEEYAIWNGEMVYDERLA